MDKPASGAFALPSSPDELGRVGYRLHVELAQLQTVHGFQRVFYESPMAPSHNAGFTNMRTIGLVLAIASHIESYCYAKNLRCRQVGMGSWRRTFLGKGAGEKSATFKAWSRERCRQLGWNVRSHDEADACGILDYAIGLDPSFRPPWRDDALMFQDMSKPPIRRKAG